MPKSNGAILWEGPSRIDGKPIVVIATNLVRKSENGKTGGMVQTYIIRSDIHPVEAIKTGEDRAVCGDCPARGRLIPALLKLVLRFCYVEVAKSVASVYRAYKRGSYTATVEEAYRAAKKYGIRFGAYGEPLAVPIWVWQRFGNISNRTGYTHAWRTVHPDAVRNWAWLVMASCDRPADVPIAWEAGWRTFRMKRPEEPLIKDATGYGEMICPASVKAGKTCNRCFCCSGRPGPPSIAIDAHGCGAGNYRKWRDETDGGA